MFAFQIVRYKSGVGLCSGTLNLKYVIYYNISQIILMSSFLEANCTEH